MTENKDELEKAIIDDEKKLNLKVIEEKIKTPDIHRLKTLAHLLREE